MEGAVWARRPHCSLEADVKHKLPALVMPSHISCALHCGRFDRVLRKWIHRSVAQSHSRCKATGGCSSHMLRGSEGVLGTGVVWGTGSTGRCGRRLRTVKDFIWCRG